jgi:hypothetical protein
VPLTSATSRISHLRWQTVGNEPAGLEWTMPFESLPGGDLVAKRLEDLARSSETMEALLVSIAAPRLAGSGVSLTQSLPNPERRLYELLAREDPDSAHSRYNALLRRLTSFESALECVS